MKRWGFLAVTLFAFCVLFRNFWLYENFCQNNYDLGIYLEALRENAKGHFNPWLSVRQLNQFNDHWSAIFTLVSPISHLIGLLPLALIGEMLVLIGCAALLYRLHRRGLLGVYKLSFLLCFLYLNRDFFEAAYYPIHESTWAVFPMMFLTCFLLERSRSQEWKARDHLPLFLALLFLNLCSEQFGFATVTLGLALLTLPLFRMAATWVLPLGGFFIWWSVPGRQKFFGPIMPYFKSRILNNPFGFLSIFTDISTQGLSSIKPLILHLIGLLPLFYFLWKSRADLRTKKTESILLAGLFLALMAGRIAQGRILLQYAGMISVFWCATGLYLISEKVITKKALGFSALFFLLIVNNKIRKPFEDYLSPGRLNCVHQADLTRDQFSQRKKELGEALSLIPSEPSRILASENLGPNLIVEKPNALVFQIGAAKITSTEFFDFVVLEKNRYGTRFFTTPEQIENLFQQLKSLPNLQILKDTPDLLVVKGKIPVSVADSTNSLVEKLE